MLFFSCCRSSKIINNPATYDVQLHVQESGEKTIPPKVSSRKSRVNHSFDLSDPVVQLPSCLRLQRKSKSLVSIHTDMQSELHSSKISRNIRKHTTIVLPPNNLTHPEAQINHGVFSAVDRPKNMKKHYSTISKASVLLNLRSRHVSRIS